MVFIIVIIVIRSWGWWRCWSSLRVARRFSGAATVGCWVKAARVQCCRSWGCARLRRDNATVIAEEEGCSWPPEDYVCHPSPEEIAPVPVPLSRVESSGSRILDVGLCAGSLSERVLGISIWGTEGSARSWAVWQPQPRPQPTPQGAQGRPCRAVLN